MRDYETGGWRQCDVVIRQGEPPRDSLTIVEVQDRTKKVSMPDFDSWCRKRDSVRAQHLICVSRQGFSHQVMAGAKQQGGGVRLLTFAELEETAWPLKFKEGKLPFVWPEATLESYSIKSLTNEAPVKIASGEVAFYRNGSLTTLNQTLGSIPFPIKCTKGESESLFDRRMEFDGNDVLTMSWPGGTTQIVALTARYRIKCRQVILSMIASEYKQVDYGDGALAWVLEGREMFDGQEVGIQFIFIPQPDGMLRPVMGRGLGAFENIEGVVEFKFSVDS